SARVTARPARWPDGGSARRPVDLPRPRDPSGPSRTVRLSARLSLPALGWRHGVAAAVFGAGLFLRRLGGARLGGARSWLPMGALRIGPAAGECGHRPGRRRGLRGVLLEPMIVLRDELPIGLSPSPASPSQRERMFASCAAGLRARSR